MASVQATFLVIAICVWARPVVALQGFNGEAISFELNVELPPDVAESSLQKGFGEPEMPDLLRADLTMERFGRKSLNLVRSRFMGVPSRSMTSPDGTILETSPFKNKDVYIYTDKTMGASVACDLRTDEESGKRRCQTSVLISIDDYSCYIGGNTAKADCTQKVRGRDAIKYMTDEPRKTHSLPEKLSPLDYTLPKPGFHVVEVITAVDAKLMSTFYARYPDDPEAAQIEMTIYMSLHGNEMNVFYSSLQNYNRKFVVFVYPTTVLFPEPGEDFAWSRDYNDGQRLLANSKFDKELQRFTKKVLRKNKIEHVMSMTGYSITLERDGEVFGILGYAYGETVCANVDAYKFSINVFVNVDGAATGAHELGHALGASHDEDIGCDPSKHLMTGRPYLPNDTNVDRFFSFSKCSYKAIRKHLNDSSPCTVENGFTDEQFEEFFCSGFIGDMDNTLDRQCQVRTGYAGSAACDDVKGDIGCYSFGLVSCTNESGSCNQSLGIVWNGTPCRRNKMCFAGRCVEDFEVCPAPTTTPAPTTPAPTPTPVPAVPCTCCGFNTKRRRKKCCKTGRKKHDRADCYCCGGLRRTEAPEGFDGPRY